MLRYYPCREHYLELKDQVKRLYVKLAKLKRLVHRSQHQITSIEARELNRLKTELNLLLSLRLCMKMLHKGNKQ